MLSRQALMAFTSPLTQGSLSLPFPGSAGKPVLRCPSLLGEVGVRPGCVRWGWREQGRGWTGPPNDCGEAEKSGKRGAGPDPAEFRASPRMF